MVTALTPHSDPQPGTEPTLALVADIGGTHARFALATPVPGGAPHLEPVKRYRTADYPTLTAAAQQFLIETGAAPRRAVMAVASPLTGDQVKLTNNPWSFSITQVGHDLGLDSIEFINDFSAVSLALSVLSASDLVPVGDALPRPARGANRLSYAVLGPGTGLGVGGLIIQDGVPVVIESEGGHVGFAPVTPYESQLLAELQTRFGRVSAERIISGPGLLNLYHAACVVAGVEPQAHTPEEITEGAKADPDGLNARVIGTFCEIFGCIAGDMALAFGAWDGVFLAGGVVEKVWPWLQSGAFRARFENKGRHAELMRGIPTQNITHPYVGLLGSAVRALQSG